MRSTACRVYPAHIEPDGGDFDKANCGGREGTAAGLPERVTGRYAPRCAVVVIRKMLR